MDFICGYCRKEMSPGTRCYCPQWCDDLESREELRKRVTALLEILESVDRCFSSLYAGDGGLCSPVWADVCKALRKEPQIRMAERNVLPVEGSGA